MTTKQFDLFALGNAIIDAKYQVSDALLSDLGVQKGTMTLLDKEIFERFYAELSEGYEPYFSSGGSAANSIATFAAMSGKGCFYGSLGDDDGALLYTQGLVELGVEVLHATKTDLPTGHCLVLVTEDGERTMCTYLGASDKIDYDAAMSDAVATSRYAYFESYLLANVTTKATIKRILGECRTHGVRTVLSLSDPNIVSFCAEAINDLLADGIDMVLCNKEEACLFTGQQDVHLALQILQERCKIVAITLGKDGALIGTNDAVRTIASNTQVKAIDTTGAGDTFAGALLYALCCGSADVDKAIDYANRVAAEVVTTFNSRLPQETCQRFVAEYF